MPITWDEAIRKVLNEAEGPLHYTEIAERIANAKLYEPIGANPAANVAAILAHSLRDPTSSPYQRLGGGQYALKAQLEAEETQHATAPVVEETKTGALGALGMFWRRDLVNWEPKSPRLWGRQSANASLVDFSEQIGVYLLHDRDRVIYVGQATDTLTVRLRAHITDRLGGRWDRFSWFGLRGVHENARLAEANLSWTQKTVIETFEALLIESLEPPLNRRRGDNLSAIEYLQAEDPDAEARKAEKLLTDLIKRQRSDGR